MLLGRTGWLSLFYVTFLIVCACSFDGAPQPEPITVSPEIDSIKKSSRTEINQVIAKFLRHDEPIPFRLWVEVDGHTVAHMTGTATEDEWALEGRHEEQSLVQLSGRGEEVEWTTEQSSGMIKGTTLGLYAPHAHLNDLLDAFQDLEFMFGNQHETEWTIIRFSLTEEKLKRIAEVLLGDRLADEDVVQAITDQMTVRYTLWYNKESHELHQLKMDLTGVGAKQSMTYLFGETS